MRREPRGEAADIFGRFDRLFDEWVRMTPFRSAPFPHWWDAEDLIRVEEYREDGMLVIRADLPGIDPDADVELTVSDGMPHIQAERREASQVPVVPVAIEGTRRIWPPGRAAIHGGQVRVVAGSSCRPAA